MPVVAFSCSVPDEIVVLAAVRVALKPVAPAGAAKLKSTVSETPPAATFLQKGPRRRRGAGSVSGRMAFISRPGFMGVGEWGAHIIGGTPPGPIG